MRSLKAAYDEAIAALTRPGSPYEIAVTAIAGREYRAYARAPGSLRELFLADAGRTDREYLVFEDERWTFGQVLQQAASIACYLRDGCGVCKGDRVAIAMRNYPEWMTAYIATTCIGAVAVPLNSWGQTRELGFALTDSGARAVFCDQERLHRLQDVLAGGDVRGILARSGAPVPHLQTTTVQDIVERYAGAPMPDAEIAPDDLAMILYTSGTTGTPKGAVSTHRAVCQSIVNFECAGAAAAMLDPSAMARMQSGGGESVQMLAVPLFHVSGCHVIFLASFRAGRKVVMLYKWDAERALELIEQERVTILSAAPAMLMELFDSPRYENTDTGSLFSIGIGGSATPPRLARMIESRIPGAYAGTGWSMTETNGAGTSLTGSAFRSKQGSAGLVHPIVDLRICDTSGNELPWGAVGEVRIKSPTLIREYWNRPDANLREFTDGWFSSGDAGYVDEDGCLFLADRSKDMVIRGGENIYPAEIETVLYDFAAIREVAGFGLPDDRLGEQLAVVVVPNPGMRISPDEIREFVGSRLAKFKVPHFVFFRDEPLPRNASGKVVKSVLAAQYGIAAT
jgi:long-chain acyl-CoA synthetase